MPPPVKRPLALVKVRHVIDIMSCFTDIINQTKAFFAFTTLILSLNKIHRMLIR